jgi:aminopeptidase
VARGPRGCRSPELVAYRPPQEIVDRYARVLVRFALNDGVGVQPGQVVRLVSDEQAKPLFAAARNEILRAGGLVLPAYQPAGIAREAIELASPEQLQTFLRRYWRGLADTVDHSVTIWARDPRELEGVDPRKLLLQRKALLPYRRWLDEKETRGRFSWTLALYGTSALAREARMPLRDYWQQIIRACFLDDPDPIARWREAMGEIRRVMRRLDRLALARLHLEADDADLWLTLGEGRKWLGGTGHNIPSFEIFTSPDWRGTEGTVSFNEPLYHYGALIRGIRLRFERGNVTEASAQTNEPLLLEMLATDPGARRLGEFSLTDGRISRITRFMAETLYDENRGGAQGNFHLALGNAYKDAYPGDPAALERKDWKALGYNESAVHTDIVSTSRRRVTGYLPGGRTRAIYEDGRFLV